MREQDPSLSDLEKETVNQRFVLVLLGVIAIAFRLAFLGNKGWPDAAIGVGSALVASVIVVWLYGRFAEERSIRRIARESATASVSATHDFLVKHFEQVVPRRTYAKTTSPTVEFQRDFVPQLAGSRFYFHRGSDASFAAFRICCLAHHQAIKAKLRISFCVLDPRADQLLRQRAKLELEAGGGSYTQEQLACSTEQVRRAIFIAMEALFSVRHNRSVQLFFHRDNPFFRAEIFDDALFISYYLGGEYPGTYLFSCSEEAVTCIRRSSTASS